MGPVKVPCEEWDPRVTLEPNFYYAQEDILWSHCERRSIGWNVVMPAAILGGESIRFQSTLLSRSMVSSNFANDEPQRANVINAQLFRTQR